MRTTQQFSITLPHDMAEAVESKIKSGAYASVSEVMRDGVRALLERDAAVERWLREEVVPGHQGYLRDPSKGVPADAILGRIKARRASRKFYFQICQHRLAFRVSRSPRYMPERVLFRSNPR